MGPTSSRFGDGLEPSWGLFGADLEPTSDMSREGGGSPSRRPTGTTLMPIVITIVVCCRIIIHDLRCRHPNRVHVHGCCLDENDILWIILVYVLSIYLSAEFWFIWHSLAGLFYSESGYAKSAHYGGTTPTLKFQSIFNFFLWIALSVHSCSPFILLHGLTLEVQMPTFDWSNHTYEFLDRVPGSHNASRPWTYPLLIS